MSLQERSDIDIISVHGHSAQHCSGFLWTKWSTNRSHLAAKNHFTLMLLDQMKHMLMKLIWFTDILRQFRNFLCKLLILRAEVNERKYGFCCSELNAPEIKLMNSDSTVVRYGAESVTQQMWFSCGLFSVSVSFSKQFELCDTWITQFMVEQWEGRWHLVLVNYFLLI